MPNRIANLRIGTPFSGDNAPAVRYYLEDHLGNCSFTLESNGALFSREEYFPFGETSFGSFTKKRYRFCGKERDEESGLYYYGARYYAPWTCRFMSVDPLAGKYPFYTPYQYAANKPLIGIDLDGLENPNDTHQGKHEVNGAVAGSNQGVEKGVDQAPIWTKAYQFANIHGTTIEEKSALFDGYIFNNIYIRQPNKPKHFLSDPEYKYNVGQANCIATTKVMCMIGNELIQPHAPEFAFLTPKEEYGLITYSTEWKHSSDVQIFNYKCEQKTNTFDSIKSEYMNVFLDKNYPQMSDIDRTNRNTGDSKAQNWNAATFSVGYGIKATYSSDNMKMIEQNRTIQSDQKYTFKPMDFPSSLNRMKEGHFGITYVPGSGDHVSLYYFNPFSEGFMRLDPYGDNSPIHVGIPALELLEEKSRFFEFIVPYKK